MQTYENKTVRNNLVKYSYLPPLTEVLCEQSSLILVKL